MPLTTVYFLQAIPADGADPSSVALHPDFPSGEVIENIDGDEFLDGILEKQVCDALPRILQALDLGPVDFNALPPFKIGDEGTLRRLPRTQLRRTALGRYEKLFVPLVDGAGDDATPGNEPAAVAAAGPPSLEKSNACATRGGSQQISSESAREMASEAPPAHSSLPGSLGQQGRGLPAAPPPQPLPLLPSAPGAAQSQSESAARQPPSPRARSSSSSQPPSAASRGDDLLLWSICRQCAQLAERQGLSDVAENLTLADAAALAEHAERVNAAAAVLARFQAQDSTFFAALVESACMGSRSILKTAAEPEKSQSRDDLLLGSVRGRARRTVDAQGDGDGLLFLCPLAAPMHGDTCVPIALLWIEDAAGSILAIRASPMSGFADGDSTSPTACSMYSVFVPWSALRPLEFAARRHGATAVRFVLLSATDKDTSNTVQVPGPDRVLALAAFSTSDLDNAAITVVTPANVPDEMGDMPDAAPAAVPRRARLLAELLGCTRTEAHPLVACWQHLCSDAAIGLCAFNDLVRAIAQCDTPLTADYAHALLHSDASAGQAPADALRYTIDTCNAAGDVAPATLTLTLSAAAYVLACGVPVDPPVLLQAVATAYAAAVCAAPQRVEHCIAEVGTPFWHASALAWYADNGRGSVWHVLAAPFFAPMARDIGRSLAHPAAAVDRDTPQEAMRVQLTRKEFAQALAFARNANLLIDSAKRAHGPKGIVLALAAAAPDADAHVAVLDAVGETGAGVPSASLAMCRACARQLRALAENIGRDPSAQAAPAVASALARAASRAQTLDPHGSIEAFAAALVATVARCSDALVGTNGNTLPPTSLPADAVAAVDEMAAAIAGAVHETGGALASPKLLDALVSAPVFRLRATSEAVALALAAIASNVSGSAATLTSWFEGAVLSHGVASETFLNVCELLVGEESALAPGVRRRLLDAVALRVQRLGIDELATLCTGSVGALTQSHRDRRASHAVMHIADAMASALRKVGSDAAHGKRTVSAADAARLCRAALALVAHTPLFTQAEPVRAYALKSPLDIVVLAAVLAAVACVHEAARDRHAVAEGNLARELAQEWLVPCAQLLGAVGSWVQLHPLIAIRTKSEAADFPARIASVIARINALVSDPDLSVQKCKELFGLHAGVTSVDSVAPRTQQIVELLACASGDVVENLQPPDVVRNKAHAACSAYVDAARVVRFSEPVLCAVTEDLRLRGFALAGQDGEPASDLVAACRECEDFLTSPDWPILTYASHMSSVCAFYRADQDRCGVLALHLEGSKSKVGAFVLDRLANRTTGVPTVAVFWESIGIIVEELAPVLRGLLSGTASMADVFAFVDELESATESRLRAEAVQLVQTAGIFGALPAGATVEDPALIERAVGTFRSAATFWTLILRARLFVQLHAAVFPDEHESDDRSSTDESALCYRLAAGGTASVSVQDAATYMDKLAWLGKPSFDDLHFLLFAKLASQLDVLRSACTDGLLALAGAPPPLSADQRSGSQDDSIEWDQIFNDVDFHANVEMVREASKRIDILRAVRAVVRVRPLLLALATLRYERGPHVSLKDFATQMTGIECLNPEQPAAEREALVSAVPLVPEGLRELQRVRHEASVGQAKQDRDMLRNLMSESEPAIVALSAFDPIAEGRVLDASEVVARRLTAFVTSSSGARRDLVSFEDLSSLRNRLLLVQDLPGALETGPSSSRTPVGATAEDDAAAARAQEADLLDAFSAHLSHVLALADVCVRYMLHGGWVSVLRAGLGAGLGTTRARASSVGGLHQFVQRAKEHIARKLRVVADGPDAVEREEPTVSLVFALPLWAVDEGVVAKANALLSLWVHRLDTLREDYVLLNSFAMADLALIFNRVETGSKKAIAALVKRYCEASTNANRMQRDAYEVAKQFLRWHESHHQQNMQGAAQAAETGRDLLTVPQQRLAGPLAHASESNSSGGSSYSGTNVAPAGMLVSSADDLAGSDDTGSAGDGSNFDDDGEDNDDSTTDTERAEFVASSEIEKLAELLDRIVAKLARRTNRGAPLLRRAAVALGEFPDALSLTEAVPNIVFVAPERGAYDALARLYVHNGNMHIPKCDDILFCSAQTTAEEVHLLLRRVLATARAEAAVRADPTASSATATVAFGYRTHCLVCPEHLSNSVQADVARFARHSFLHSAERDTWRRHVRFACVTAVSSSGGELPVVVEALREANAHEVDLQADSVSVAEYVLAQRVGSSLDDKQRPCVQLVLSDGAGSGKTTYIAHAARSRGWDIVSILLSSESSARSTIEALARVFAERSAPSTIVHIDVGAGTPRTLSDLFFALFFVGAARMDGAVPLTLPQAARVVIELPSGACGAHGRDALLQWPALGLLGAAHRVTLDTLATAATVKAPHTPKGFLARLDRVGKYIGLLESGELDSHDVDRMLGSSGFAFKSHRSSVCDWTVDQCGDAVMRAWTSVAAEPAARASDITVAAFCTFVDVLAREFAALPSRVLAEHLPLADSVPKPSWKESKKLARDCGTHKRFVRDTLWRAYVFASLRPPWSFGAENDGNGVGVQFAEALRERKRALVLFDAAARLFIAIPPPPPPQARRAHDVRERLSEDDRLYWDSVQERLRQSMLDDVFASRVQAVALLQHLSGSCASPAAGDPAYVLTPDNLLKMVAVYQRAACGVPVILRGESGVGKTKLMEYLCDITGTTLFQMDVHGEKGEADVRAMMRRGVSSFARTDAASEGLAATHRNDTAFAYLQWSRDRLPESEYDWQPAEDPLVRDERALLHKYVRWARGMRVAIARKLKAASSREHGGGGDDDESDDYLRAAGMRRALHAATAYMIERELLGPLLYGSEIVGKCPLGSAPEMAWVFFDEINTSTAIDMFKCLVCDQTLDGVALPAPIRVLAACNPLRYWSEGALKRSEVRQQAALTVAVSPAAAAAANAPGEPAAALPRIPVYHVHPLARSMEQFVLDFHSITKDNLREYASGMLLPVLKLNRTRADLHELVITMAVTAHLKVRELEGDPSVVSLRDIHRFGKLFTWFRRYLAAIAQCDGAAPAWAAALPAERDDACAVRAALLAAGIAYGLRLPVRHVPGAPLTDRPWRYQLDEVLDACVTQYSDAWAAPLRDWTRLHAHSVVAALDEEARWLVAAIRGSLGHGVADCTALRENLFAMFVCTMTLIPIFIVGRPGSSKSLAMKIIFDCFSTQHGRSSNVLAQKQFRSAEVVARPAGMRSALAPPPLQQQPTSGRGRGSLERQMGLHRPVVAELACTVHQCSRLSTSDEIERVFRRVQAEQDSDTTHSFIGVLFLDEVGLAEASPRLPLKVLHALLETPAIAVVGLSNYGLDASKMNRAVFLVRDAPPHAELAELAYSIARSEAEDEIRRHRGLGMRAEDDHDDEASALADEITRELHETLARIADVYSRVHSAQAEHSLVDFYGLRDFFSAVKMLAALSVRRHFALPRETEPIPGMSLPMQSVFSTFGGTPAACMRDLVLPHCRALDAARTESLLADQSAFGALFSRESVAARLRKALGDTSMRHAMLLVDDEAEALAFLRRAQIIEHNTEVIFGSAFADDQVTGDHTCACVRRIRDAMADGRRIVLAHHEVAAGAVAGEASRAAVSGGVLEACLDVLNKAYTFRFGQAYCRIALFDESTQSPVDLRFKAIILVRAHDALGGHVPAPLLNRCDKYVLTRDVLLGHDLADTARQAMRWAVRFAGRVASPQDSFAVYSDHVVRKWAAALEPPAPDAPRSAVQLESLQRLLINIAVPDAFDRLQATDLTESDRIVYTAMYFGVSRGNMGVAHFRDSLAALVAAAQHVAAVCAAAPAPGAAPRSLRDSGAAASADAAAEALADPLRIVALTHTHAGVPASAMLGDSDASARVKFVELAEIRSSQDFVRVAAQFFGGASDAHDVLVLRHAARAGEPALLLQAAHILDNERARAPDRAAASRRVVVFLLHVARPRALRSAACGADEQPGPGSDAAHDNAPGDAIRQAIANSEAAGGNSLPGAATSLLGWTYVCLDDATLPEAGGPLERETSVKSAVQRLTADDFPALARRLVKSALALVQYPHNVALPADERDAGGKPWHRFRWRQRNPLAGTAQTGVAHVDASAWRGARVRALHGTAEARGLIGAESPFTWALAERVLAILEGEVQRLEDLWATVRADARSVSPHGTLRRALAAVTYDAVRRALAAALAACDNHLNLDILIDLVLGEAAAVTGDLAAQQRRRGTHAGAPLALNALLRRTFVGLYACDTLVPARAPGAGLFPVQPPIGTDIGGAAPPTADTAFPFGETLARHAAQLLAEAKRKAAAGTGSARAVVDAWLALLVRKIGAAPLEIVNGALAPNSAKQASPAASKDDARTRLPQRNNRGVHRAIREPPERGAATRDTEVTDSFAALQLADGATLEMRGDAIGLLCGDFVRVFVLPDVRRALAPENRGAPSAPEPAARDPMTAPAPSDARSDLCEGAFEIARSLLHCEVCAVVRATGATVVEAVLHACLTRAEALRALLVAAARLGAGALRELRALAVQFKSGLPRHGWHSPASAGRSAAAAGSGERAEHDAIVCAAEDLLKRIGASAKAKVEVAVSFRAQILSSAGRIAKSLQESFPVAQVWAHLVLTQSAIRAARDRDVNAVLALTTSIESTVAKALNEASDTLTLCTSLLDAAHEVAELLRQQKNTSPDLARRFYAAFLYEYMWGSLAAMVNEAQLDQCVDPDKSPARRMVDILAVPWVAPRTAASELSVRGPPEDVHWIEANAPSALPLAARTALARALPSQTDSWALSMGRDARMDTSLDTPLCATFVAHEACMVAAEYRAIGVAAKRTRKINELAQAAVTALRENAASIHELHTAVHGLARAKVVVDLAAGAIVEDQAAPGASAEPMSDEVKSTLGANLALLLREDNPFATALTIYLVRSLRIALGYSGALDALAKDGAHKLLGGARQGGAAQACLLAAEQLRRPAPAGGHADAVALYYDPAASAYGSAFRVVSRGVAREIISGARETGDAHVAADTLAPAVRRATTVLGVFFHVKLAHTLDSDTELAKLGVNQVCERIEAGTGCFACLDKARDTPLALCLAVNGNGGAAAGSRGDNGQTAHASAVAQLRVASQTSREHVEILYAALHAYLAFIATGPSKSCIRAYVECAHSGNAVLPGALAPTTPDAHEAAPAAALEAVQCACGAPYIAARGAPPGLCAACGAAVVADDRLDATLGTQRVARKSRGKSIMAKVPLVGGLLSRQGQRKAGDDTAAAAVPSDAAAGQVCSISPFAADLFQFCLHASALYQLAATSECPQHHMLLDQMVASEHARDSDEVRVGDLAARLFDSASRLASATCTPVSEALAAVHVFCASVTRDDAAVQKSGVKACALPRTDRERVEFERKWQMCVDGVLAGDTVAAAARRAEQPDFELGALSAHRRATHLQSPEIAMLAKQLEAAFVESPNLFEKQTRADVLPNALVPRAPRAPSARELRGIVDPGQLPVLAHFLARVETLTCVRELPDILAWALWVHDAVQGRASASDIRALSCAAFLQSSFVGDNERASCERAFARCQAAWNAVAATLREVTVSLHEHDNDLGSACGGDEQGSRVVSRSAHSTALPIPLLSGDSPLAHVLALPAGAARGDDEWDTTGLVLPALILSLSLAQNAFLDDVERLVGQHASRYQGCAVALDGGAVPARDIGSGAASDQLVLVDDDILARTIAIASVDNGVGSSRVDLELLEALVCEAFVNGRARIAGALPLVEFRGSMRLAGVPVRALAVPQEIMSRDLSNVVVNDSYEDLLLHQLVDVLDLCLEFLSQAEATSCTTVGQFASEELGRAVSRDDLLREAPRVLARIPLSHAFDAWSWIDRQLGDAMSTLPSDFLQQIDQDRSHDDAFINTVTQCGRTSEALAALHEVIRQLRAPPVAEACARDAPLHLWAGQALARLRMRRDTDEPWIQALQGKSLVEVARVWLRLVEVEEEAA